MLKNSGLGSEIAAAMDGILEDPKFKAVFSTPSYDDALSQDSSYRAFVRVASKKCEDCDKTSCECKTEETKSSKTKASKSDDAETTKEAAEYVINNLITTSKVLENIGLKRSAAVILLAVEGIIREASSDEEGLSDEGIDDIADLMGDEDIPTLEDTEELPDDLGIDALASLSKKLNKAGLVRSAAISLGLAEGIVREAQNLFDSKPGDEDPNMDFLGDNPDDEVAKEVTEADEYDQDAELAAQEGIEPHNYNKEISKDQYIEDFVDEDSFEDEDDLSGNGEDDEVDETVQGYLDAENPPVEDEEVNEADDDDDLFGDEEEEPTEPSEEDDEESSDEEPTESSDEECDEDDAECSNMVKDKTAIAAYNDLVRWIKA